MPTWRGAARRLRGAPPPVPGTAQWRGLSRQSPQDVLDLVYELILGREPDGAGTASFLEGMRNGTLTPQELAAVAIASGEWWSVTPFPGLGPSLHFSRMMFVRSLPPAKRILDLGGTSLGNATGALVLMGYPYPFDDLVVIDLPSEERNELYREAASREVTQTALGPVRYRYHSMADLSDFADASVDLVYSGQSIEHVPVDVGDTVLSEVRRVLRPGGYLGLDTPNARVHAAAAGRVHRPRPRARVHRRRDARQAHWGGLRGGRRVGSEPRGPQPARRPLRGRPGGHGTRAVPRDRGLLPARLPVPRGGLTEPVPGGRQGPAAALGCGRELRCGREDSNLHPLAGTGT